MAVAEIGGQVRQVDVDVSFGPIPVKHCLNRKAMPQVMHARTWPIWTSEAPPRSMLVAKEWRSRWAPRCRNLIPARANALPTSPLTALGGLLKPAKGALH